MTPGAGGMGGNDWRINEIATELVVTDAVGALGPEEVKKIVGLVLEHLRHEQQRSSQRARDTTIDDRAYRSDVR
jgi:hypothetical protein